MLLFFIPFFLPLHETGGAGKFINNEVRPAGTEEREARAHRDQAKE